MAEKKPEMIVMPTPPSGMAYNWELIYYGSDPTNDIVGVP